MGSIRSKDFCILWSTTTPERTILAKWSSINSGILLKIMQSTIMAKGSITEAITMAIIIMGMDLIMDII